MKKAIILKIFKKVILSGFLLLLHIITAQNIYAYPNSKIQAWDNTDSINVQNLEEVVITDQSARNRLLNGKLGSENIELSKLSLFPKAFGEADIIKSLSLLPGVRNETDGSGGFEVRGGTAYQNLVSMDGMTLYNPAHLMGIFSTFNEDAMNSATLHKGPIPATFGGASSSVLETYMKPGNPDKYNFSGTIGILNAKVAASGPVVKDKLSFAVSGRISYADIFLKLIPEYKGTIINFFDVNAKMRYNYNPENRLDISFFAARDNLAVSKLMELHWGNIAGSINWSIRKNDWSFLTTTSLTDYSSNMGMEIMDSNQKLKEFIKSFSLNEKIVYEISESHNLEFGLRSELLKVKSGDITIGNSKEMDIRSGLQNALWVNYEGEIFSFFTLNLGLRASLFSVIKGKGFQYFQALNEPQPEIMDKTYFNAEPRFSLKFSINEYHNLKAGFSIATQNFHGLRSTVTTFPFDRYAISSHNIKPEEATQYSIGYGGMTSEGGWDWSAEFYFKSMKNIYDYRDGVNMFSQINLENLILGGKGRSFGMELLLRKNIGKFTGWLSYTLSKTECKIPGINDDRWYLASNHHLNDIAVVGLYEFNERWEVSASWTYSSGRPLTAPDGKYEIAGTTCYYYSARNSYQTPPSHRLDLSATYTKTGKKITSIVSFGIFNVYSHQSPFIIYFEDDPTKPSGTRAVQRSLFGIIPSISYTIKF